MYRILIAEDEKIILKGIRYATDWAKLGCVVVAEAENGRQGLALIAQTKPDIVLSDVRMPLLDGLEMIREAAKTHHFETILISAYDEFAYAQEAVRLGVSEYLLKPINGVQLEQAVAHVCQKCRLSREVQQLEAQMRKAERPAPAGSSQCCLDVAGLEQKKRTLSRYPGQMVQEVQRGYSQHLGLLELSEKYGVSTTHLSREFKKEMGCTFNDFLSRYRISRAVEMMKHGTYHIYEVAEMTGFSNYKYFITVFHKYMECTPTEFMQANGAKSEETALERPE